VIRVYLDRFCNELNSSVKILVVNMSTPKRKRTGLLVGFYSETESCTRDDVLLLFFWGFISYLHCISNIFYLDLLPHFK
jgi:hypothetical protein